MNQVEKAKENGFLLTPVKNANSKSSTPLLAGTIKGATVYSHTMPEGDVNSYSAAPSILKTFFLFKGAIRITNRGNNNKLGERTCYTANPEGDIKISSDAYSHFMEIQWNLTEDDRQFLANQKTCFPLIRIYDDCEQYREDFKSPKTISRSIIGQHALPRFCMGSVESNGPDKMQPHAHPYVDQFFYSFPENDINLLIDDKVQPFEGNTIFYIPLGSNHGVDVPEGKKMHYIWIDFIIDPRGIEYLDEVHIPTGVKEQVT